MKITTALLQEHLAYFLKINHHFLNRIKNCRFRLITIILQGKKIMKYMYLPKSNTPGGVQTTPRVFSSSSTPPYLSSNLYSSLNHFSFFLIQPPAPPAPSSHFFIISSLNSNNKSGQRWFGKTWETPRKVFWTSATFSKKRKKREISPQLLTCQNKKTCCSLPPYKTMIFACTI